MDLDVESLKLANNEDLKSYLASLGYLKEVAIACKDITKIGTNDLYELIYSYNYLKELDLKGLNDNGLFKDIKELITLFEVIIANISDEAIDDIESKGIGSKHIRLNKVKYDYKESGFDGYVDKSYKSIQAGIFGFIRSKFLSISVIFVLAAIVLFSSFIFNGNFIGVVDNVSKNSTESIIGFSIKEGETQLNAELGASYTSEYVSILNEVPTGSAMWLKPFIIGFQFFMSICAFGVIGLFMFSFFIDLFWMFVPDGVIDTLLSKFVSEEARNAVTECENKTYILSKVIEPNKIKRNTYLLELMLLDTPNDFSLKKLKDIINGKDKKSKYYALAKIEFIYDMRLKNKEYINIKNSSVTNLVVSNTNEY